MTQSSKGGRPPQYSDAQVLAAVEHVEKSGHAPDTGRVKETLCERFEVSPGINAQSLAEAIKRVVEIRDRERLQAQIEALPENVRTEAGEIGSTVFSSLLELLGPLFHQLRQIARREVEAKEVDNRALRREVGELHGNLRERDERIAEVEQLAQDRLDELSRVTAERDALRKQIDEQQTENALLERITALIQKSGGERPDQDRSGPTES